MSGAGGARGEWRSHFWIPVAVRMDDVQLARDLFRNAVPGRVLVEDDDDNSQSPRCFYSSDRPSDDAANQASPTTTTTVLLHVSLTKPFAVAHHEIEPLQQRASSRLCKMPAFYMGLGSGLVELPSEDGEFTYGAVTIAQGRHELNAIIDDLDEILADFNKSEYFEPRVLHVSFCKWPGAPQAEPVKYPSNIKFKTHSVLVDRVWARAGHLEFRIVFRGS